MTSTAGFTNSPIPEVLNRYNFETWRSLMETYLMAKDLWEIIDPKRDPQPGDWKRKNAKALHAIQKSCGLEMLKFVSETKMAKLAWEILEDVSIRIAGGENNKEQYEQCRRFTNLVSMGEWNKAKEFLKSKELDIQSVIRATARFEGYSAIHVAAGKGHVNILKDLIKIMSHEDLKKKNVYGNTPLHVAVINGKLYTVKLLLFYMGEKVNNDGDTALHVAVKSGEVEILKELVSNMRYTDMRMRNNYGNTALHLAVLAGNIDMIQVLAPLMGDVRCPNGDTAVHIAVKRGATKEVVRELLLMPSWMHEEIYNDEYYTALHLAVNKAQVPIVKQFMPRKREHRFGRNCIEFTTYVERGEWDNAKGCLTEQDDLCDAITAVNPRDGYGNTALHLAAAAGHVHIVKEMISLLKGREENLKLKDPEFEHRIDPKAFQIPSSMSVAVNEDLALNNPEYLGNYPIPTGINLVAMKDHVLKNAEYMIEQYDQKLSRILEVQNTAVGATVLHVAAWYGYVDMVRELVPLMTTEGLEIQDNRGFTPLLNAVDMGHRDIVRELLLIMRPTGLEIKTMEKGATVLHFAAWNGNVDMVKELMAVMTSEGLEIQDDQGCTPLLVAMERGHMDIVRELLPKMRPTGLEIKTMAKGATVLHFAACDGNVDMVKELMAVMTSEGLEIQDDQGCTPLLVAMERGHMDIVRELLPKMRPTGLEIKTMAKGATVLHFAACDGNVDMVKELMAVMTSEGLEIQDDQGCTPLLVAMERGHMDIVRELLPKMRPTGLEIKTMAKGATVLHFAACDGNVDMVKELMAVMTSEGLEIQDDQGCTPLLVAMERGHMDIVRDLLPKMRPTGLEIKTMAKGATVLHFAAWNGNVDMVKELMAAMTSEGLEIQDDQGCTPLLVAVDRGHRDIVRELLSMMRPTGLEIKTTEHGENALHHAIMTKNMDIAEEVMRYMRKDALEDKDGYGYTALGRALTEFKEEEVIGIVKYMAENSPKVFGIPVPPLNWIPAVNGYTLLKKWDFCRNLYHLTPLEYLIPEKRSDGSRLIIHWLRANQFDLVLHLLGRCSKIDIFLLPAGEEGWAPIVELARMSSEFPSATHLGFRRRLIYNRLCTDLADDNALHINITQDNEQDNQTDLIPSGVGESPETKRIGNIDIIRCIGEMLKEKPPTPAQHDVLRRSLIEAVEHGNVEFVTHICEACPSLAWSREKNKNIFHVAVESRQHKIYNLLYRIDEEDRSEIIVAKYPETMLNLAAKISPLLRFNHIRGAALQLQRELQWFKEVESIMKPEMREIRNSDGITPRELFTKNHEILKKEAEDSMKATASSCTVVGALIVTIMFAAAFTFPGGNNGNTGYPMFLSKDLFFVFIVSDTISLVSSTTSVITFLGIFTSRYAEEDFLKNLPTKMMIGLSTLFVSIVTMMIAFSSALIIMLHKQYSWAITPAIFATSVPVLSYIGFQFPLLIEMFWSTYGPGLFDKKLKKGKPWIKL